MGTWLKLNGSIAALGLLCALLIPLKTQEVTRMGLLLGWAWRHMLVILALGMWKEQKSEANLGYVRLSLVSKAGKGTIQRMKKPYWQICIR